MRRYYPYLQNPFNRNLNDAQETSNFLKKIDGIVNQRQYFRITLLNWEEEPLKEIQGDIVSGSMTKDGSSSVRRTVSLSVNVDGNSYTLDDAYMDFAINKKIFLEIGIKNDTDEFAEYPILWFPQGVFFIGEFSITSSTTSSVNISLSLKDKMCMLNGDVGGKLPATTIFDEVDTQDPSGAYISEKVLIYNIIQEAVNHFGGEDLNNIIIEDVDSQIRRVIKWTGDNPLYLVQQGGAGNVDNSTTYIARTDKPDASENVSYRTYHNGDDVGYVYDDFTYIGELTMGTGDTVCGLLDNIVSYLGNYEYFYDEYGLFHFREIKNYINTTQATAVADSMSKNDYLVDTTNGKSVYTFSDNSNIISISCNPQYSNIKNDYIVEGLRKSTSSDISYPVRYHLAIDEKPRKTEMRDDGSMHYKSRSNFLLYREEGSELVKGIFPLQQELPEVGNFNVVYAPPSGGYYYWDDEYKEVDAVEYFPSYEPVDWRTELYIQGLEAKNNGTDQGYYFSELESGWLGIYNLQTQRFYGQEAEQEFYVSSLTDGDYFLDFIEPSSTTLGKYSVSSIGRRSDIVSSDDVNCLFTPDIPNVVFINMDDDDASEQQGKLNSKGEPWSVARGNIFSAFATGGYKNGAFDQIKYELYLHTNYQCSLSISALPIYYLDTNSRITVSDKTTNTYGDFVITSISFTFGSGALMTVSANEVFERF